MNTEKAVMMFKNRLIKTDRAPFESALDAQTRLWFLAHLNEDKDNENKSALESDCLSHKHLHQRKGVSY